MCVTTYIWQERKIRREIANSNERRRMQSINAGFQSLRTLLPQHEGEKLSKVNLFLHSKHVILKTVTKVCYHFCLRGTYRSLDHFAVFKRSWIFQICWSRSFGHIKLSIRRRSFGQIPKLQEKPKIWGGNKPSVPVRTFGPFWGH